MAKKTILIVEDEGDIRDLMIIQLQRAGYVVDSASDGEVALTKIQNQAYDLLVLDWMLPGLSGLEVAQTVRKQNLPTKKTVPILMVTAKTDARDIVQGLEAGADDYLTKPFEAAVLLARVNALLRRAGDFMDHKATVGEEISIGDITIRLEAHEASRGDERLQLTLSEFKLLVALAKHRGRVLTRDRLIDLVQGAGVNVTDRTIDTHIFGLRKKLGQSADYIETIRGVGYRIGSVAS